ncbi:hypothetical protein EV401DRAFT_1114140 [Pisolithus croceorrhizus]|nr:hypothetical protein EV401DRAFT_1114140 [Pisolithus croceorrhizus]
MTGSDHLVFTWAPHACYVNPRWTACFRTASSAWLSPTLNHIKEMLLRLAVLSHPFLFSLFSLLAFALLAFSQTTTETLSYDTTYDDASEPLSNLACSDGVYGLETKGYNTLGDLPTFPNVGGVYTVTGMGLARVRDVLQRHVQ